MIPDAPLGGRRPGRAIRAPFHVDQGTRIVPGRAAFPNRGAVVLGVRPVVVVAGDPARLLRKPGP
jgi:hypothetical protein